MAYAAGDVILDDHYNAFVTSLNAMFAAGSADLGYNQSALATVSAAIVSPADTVQVVAI